MAQVMPGRALDACGLDGRQPDPSIEIPGIQMRRRILTWKHPHRALPGIGASKDRLCLVVKHYARP
jgi:hypothetical protein